MRQVTYHLVQSIPKMGVNSIPKHQVVEGQGTGVNSAAQATRHMLGSIVTFVGVVRPRKGGM